MTRAAGHSPTAMPETEKDQPEAEPWRGIGSSRCYSARTDRKMCKCRCRGELHGIAQQDRLREKRIEEFS